MQQLMPGFLQLLSIDYERWAAGRPMARSDSTGSLLAKAQSAGGGVKAPTALASAVAGKEEAAAGSESVAATGSKGPSC